MTLKTFIVALPIFNYSILIRYVDMTFERCNIDIYVLFC